MLSDKFSHCTVSDNGDDPLDRLRFVKGHCVKDEGQGEEDNENPCCLPAAEYTMNYRDMGGSFIEGGTTIDNSNERTRLALAKVFWLLS